MQRVSLLLFVPALAACTAPAAGEPVFQPPVVAAQEPAHPHVAPPPPPTSDHGGWNAAQIAWRSFTDGQAESRRTHKPMLLVLYATWCGHCANFSHVFENADVVAASRDFVMVRADSDREPEVAHRYAPDGQYVPRTFFLSPDGNVVESVKAHDGRYAYFYDEHGAGNLLASMRIARTAVQ